MMPQHLILPYALSNLSQRAPIRVGFLVECWILCEISNAISMLEPNKNKQQTYRVIVEENNSKTNSFLRTVNILFLLHWSYVTEGLHSILCDVQICRVAVSSPENICEERESFFLQDTSTRSPAT